MLAFNVSLPPSFNSIIGPLNMMLDAYSQKRMKPKFSNGITLQNDVE